MEDSVTRNYTDPEMSTKETLHDTNGGEDGTFVQSKPSHASVSLYLHQIMLFMCHLLCFSAFEDFSL